MHPALPVSISDWLRAYAAGASPRDLLVRCLDHLRQNSPPAVWIHLATDAELLAQIEQLEALSTGAGHAATLAAAHPLFGVPFAVKDNIDIAGVPTTAACPAYLRLPAVSATAMQRLQAAGAVWMGKTNLDQFATGLVGTRSPHGRPSSVFSTDHVSGGSSSGSAVAVAAGMVPFSLGTDTAGSGRVPAGFNQIVGLKPTPGRVGTGGVLPACRSLDCVSVFALTVQDAAHVLSVIEGPDETDSYSRYQAGPAAWPRARLRVGIPRSPRMAGKGEYVACFEAAVAALSAQGHEVVPLDFEPLHRVAALLYDGPWVVERYDVVKELMDSNPSALDPSVRAIIGRATGHTALDVFRAQYGLRALQQQSAGIWSQADLLMVPTAPLHPSFADVDAEPLSVNGVLGTYTNFVNLLGWCALALPAGSTADGLPFGVTFIAPGHHDAALARFARDWQLALGLPPGRPGLAAGSGILRDAGLLRLPAVEKQLKIAVVGAHLSGLPLNGQLIERGAQLLQATSTSASYRLYALPGGPPFRPGLVRVASGGRCIALEVWSMPMAEAGAFLASIPPPLGLGSVELADGSRVQGFLCEPHALAEAQDISEHGGWRAYLAAQQAEVVRA